MTTIPTPGQLAWQRARFGVFCHFGINTFYGKEWSDGSLDPAGFAPTELDPRQWAETAAAAGARYLVLTAKHHDGFCLWPTDTTDYSVRSSPFQGDVVELTAQACRDAGIGLGLYLSPWDRNASCYPDPAAYDDFYRRQLTELCTRYGPLFEIWFDGAGSEGRTYDWDGIMAVVDEHQPDAMVFNMGRPTIRWVGNEDGLASDPCRYVVDGHYLPPECDVPIRAHWFWQPDDIHTLKSTEHLLAIYYRSIGLGAGLLLNVPPDRRGLLDDADVARVREASAEIYRRFGNATEAVLDGSVARLPERTAFDHITLCEDLTNGQHITEHRIFADGELVATGGTIGNRRIHVTGLREASELRIEANGTLGTIGVHLTGVTEPPRLESQPGMLAGKVDPK
jgi:alpha-L-fucosidase